MDYTDDERADAARDLVALIRAKHNGDEGGIEAIVDSVGERELRAVLATFTDAFGDLLVRLTVAASAIENEEMQAFVMNASYDTMMSHPDIRAAVEQNIENIQAGVIGGA